ncbi:hypothetical protein [Flavobacterium gelatinilyticum]|uniref:hypothetical protein n=1 Tax=Flavobacterium gelatinilyticum TaxID=3003260 RepID=UPI0024806B9D|nr:hypothetical protein [Flavobacterium gelatinilyticum]
MQISKQEIDKISNFIQRAILDLKQKNVKRDDIIIAMPCFFEAAFSRLFSCYPPPDYDHNRLRIAVHPFFNCFTQPHFKNEIVVFYKYYYYDEAYFIPHVHTIVFEDEKKINE